MSLRVKRSNLAFSGDIAAHWGDLTEYCIASRINLLLPVSSVRLRTMIAAMKC